MPDTPKKGDTKTIEVRNRDGSMRKSLMEFDGVRWHFKKSPLPNGGGPPEKTEEKPAPKDQEKRPTTGAAADKRKKGGGTGKTAASAPPPKKSPDKTAKTEEKPPAKTEPGVVEKLNQEAKQWLMK